MVCDEQPKPIESSGVTHGVLIDYDCALGGADRTRGAGDLERRQLDIDKRGQFRLVQGPFELVDGRLSLPRLLRRASGRVHGIRTGTKRPDRFCPCSTLIREQVGGEAENVPALAFHFDFTVKSGAAQGRETRELRRLLMNPRGLEMGKAREIDTAHACHLACVHGGDGLDLGRFHPCQSLLRNHPAVANQGRPDRLKWFLELLQQPGDGRDVSRATGQHLPRKRDPVTTHHQSQHPMMVGAFLAVPPLHQHTARTAERGAGQVVEHGVHRRGPLVCQAVEQMLAEGCLVVFDGG